MMNVMKIYNDIWILFLLFFDLSRIKFSKDDKIRLIGLKMYVLYKNIIIKCFY